MEEADWLRVLALRTHLHSKPTPSAVTSPPAPPLPPRTLETVDEEERCLPLPPPPPPLPTLCQLLSSVECDSTPEEDVSPDGLLDLAEVKVTLMPDGGISCVDGVTSPSSRNEGSNNCWDKFGSTGCVTAGVASPPSPPALPRRVRRSLPCRAANIHDYTAEQQHNRILTRRQSQPEHVGLARSVPIRLLIPKWFISEKSNQRSRIDSIDWPRSPVHTGPCWHTPQSILR